MADEKLRWVQRFQNFSSAFQQLTEFIQKGTLNKFEAQGLIQCFEYNYELSWKTIKDFYESQGELSIQGSKDAFRMAFKRGLITDGELWMEMVQSRILTTHTYQESVSAEIVDKIQKKYYLAFADLKKIFDKKISD